MKKLFTFAVMALVAVAASAQMIIPGESFAKNPNSFNGRKVSVKNIQLDFSNAMPTAVGAIVPSTGLSNANVAPGANGTGTQVVRCNPPRGYSKVDVNFLAAPDFEGCFFMMDAMYNEVKRQAGGRAIDAQITFQGDSRVGYNVTFYKMGR